MMLSTDFCGSCQTRGPVSDTWARQETRPSFTPAFWSYWPLQGPWSILKKTAARAAPPSSRAPSKGCCQGPNEE